VEGMLVLSYLSYEEGKTPDAHTEPAQKWDVFQTALGCDRGIRGKYRAQDQHIEFSTASASAQCHVCSSCHACIRLMIPNEHRRPRRQMFLILQHKLHARRQPHRPFKRPRHSILAQSSIPYQPQRNRGEDPIAGAEDQAGKGQDGAGVEGGGWPEVGETMEDKCGECCDLEREGQVEEDGGHRTLTW